MLYNLILHHNFYLHIQQSFAEYVGKNYDVKLDCITISKEQFEFSKKRIFEKGLNEKVNIFLKDYRDVKDKYNSIASIEMIEASIISIDAMELYLSFTSL